MANLKFSDFTPYATTPVTATSGLVAYEGTTNIQFTPTQLAPFTGIYAANGIIGTARTALLTDILRFRDFTNTNDIFTLNSNGTFTLGLAAVTTGTNTITIGDSANTYSHSKNIAIGYSADSSASLAIAIGSDAQSTAGSAVSIGNLSESATTAGVSIGYASAVNVGATYGIAIGGNASTSGANSITLNSNSGAVDNTTANTFGVYMSSNTTPDLEVVGSGTSTLRTNLNVTGNMEVDGQAWGDLYDGGTIADGATFIPDWNNGNVQKIVIATGAAITIANGSNLNNGATYILIIEQAGVGGTVTWGGKYQWPAATPPVLSSGAAKADVITMLPYNSASILSSSTLDFLTA